MFKAIGASNLTTQDVDSAHRVPTRQAENIFKFVKRKEKDEVMSHQRELVKKKKS